MLTRVNKLFIVIFTIVGMYSCTSRGPGVPRGGAGMPNQAEKLTAKIKIFHLNNDSSRIYFSLDARKKDYFLLSDQSKYKAAYRLNYEIIHTQSGKKTRIDSSSLKLVDMQAKAFDKTITAFIDAAIPEGDNYALKLSISNLNNGALYENYLKFSKNNCTAPENIMIVSEDGKPLLEKNFIYSNGKIVTRKNCDQELKLQLIQGGEGLPTPPFSNTDFSSKNNYSAFPYNIEKENGSYSFTGLEKGFYLVSTGNNSGIIFYHFNKWYPNCNDTAGFYEPLIFISSRDEYDNLKTGENTKADFEKFWLDKAGDKPAARKAINEYYKRVFEANSEFTSVQEGWRTDRGMIYIVFGKPGYVERQINKEVWIYRTAFNSTLSYTFNKIDNPYSENDYRLERDIRYKPQWYNAVENWRRGKAFDLNGY